MSAPLHSHPYHLRIRALLEEFKIPEDYAQSRKLVLQQEENDLVVGGKDSQGKDKLISKQAQSSWQAMRRAAEQAGIELVLESGFRSVDYQADLIRKELAKGYTIEKVLTWLAAPGYSEHHTGCAIDFFPIKRDFELTKEFAWLTTNAASFGFTLSYPENNPFGFIYEPWHWRYRKL